MNKVLLGIGTLAVIGGTLVFSAWLHASCGSVAVLTFAMVSGMAAWVANAIAKGVADDARSAVMHDLGLSMKDIEDRIGMDKGQASRQLAGSERFDYARWAEIPGFEQAFADRRSKRMGGYSIVEDGLLSAAIGKLTQLLDAGVSRGVAA